MKLPFTDTFKKKEKELKVPKRQSKKIWSYQGVKRLLMGIVSFFLLLVVIGVIRLFVATETIVGLQDKVVELEKQVKVLTEDERISIDDKAFNFFMGDFLKQFITVGSGFEKVENRKIALKKYYADGVVQSSHQNASTREYKQATFIQLKTDVKPYQAIYQVQYVVSEPVEKTRKLDNGATEKYVENKAKPIVNYLVVPFVSSQGKFSVVSEPYFIAKPNVSLTQKVDELRQVGTQRVDEKTEKELNTFLNNFYPKYLNGNVEDLKYFMKEPVGLDNRLTLGKIENAQFTVNDKQANSYQALVKVTFKDKDTNFTSTFKMVLGMTKENEKYQVSHLEYVN